MLALIGFVLALTVPIALFDAPSHAADPGVAAPATSATAGAAVSVPSALGSLGDVLARVAPWGAALVGPGAASASAVRPVAPRSTVEHLGSQAETCAGGDRSAFGHPLTVNADEWLCGSVRDYGDAVTVLGRVDGDVVAVGGTITISGRVAGDVTALGGNVEVLPGAFVGGAVQSLGGAVHVDREAHIGGGVHRDGDPRAMGQLFIAPPGFGGVPWASFLFWALAAAGLARFFPETLLRIRWVTGRALGPSVALGAVAAIAGLALGLLLVLTCIGIPLAIGVAAALWVAWVVGTVGLGAALGERILLALAPRERHSLVSGALLGTLLLAAAASVPCLGIVIGLVTGCAAIGASILALAHARRSARRGIRVA